MSSSSRPGKSGSDSSRDSGGEEGVCCFGALGRDGCIKTQRNIVAEKSAFIKWATYCVPEIELESDEEINVGSCFSARETFSLIG